MKNVDHCQRIVTEGPDLVGADRLGNALIWKEVWRKVEAEKRGNVDKESILCRGTLAP
jgi:hypothetical protein